MHTVYLLVNHFSQGTGIDPSANYANASSTTQTILDNLQNILGPIFLAIIGILALTFLAKKQMKRFIEFIILAIAVAVLFYDPGIVKNLANAIAGLFIVN